MAAPRRRALVAIALVPLVVAPLALAAPAAASSTTNEIVYTIDVNEDGIYGVVLRNLDNGTVTTVLPEDAANGWVYDDPELSPDGTKIVLSTDRGSAAGDFEGLALVNRDGTGFTRLTLPDSNLPASTVIDAFPAWKPDGATVLFTRLTFTDTATETDALFTVPAAGGAATALTGGETGFTADWSPDGLRIVFTQGANPDTGVGPLFVMDANGANKTALTGATGALPAWSPDGTTIAFTEVTEFDTNPDRAADIAQISLIPAAGGTKTTLAKTRPTTARSVAEYPTWMPDSGSIVFDLYTYDADGFRNSGDLWAVDRGDVRSGRITNTPTVDEVQGHVHGPAIGNVTTGPASRYVPVSPRRILDTRPAPDNVGVAPGRLGGAETRTLPIRGLAVTVAGTASTVPADATAVVLNVTAVNASQTTDIRVYPTPASPAPGASSLNAKVGLAVPNLVTAQIGSDGAVVLRNGAGTVDLLGDIAGYYVPSATAGANGFAPLDPSRILDTRPAPDNVGAPATKVGGAQFVDLQVTGAVSTRGGGSVAVPANAQAVVLNVTATGASQNTDIRVYPTPASGSDVPVVSNLNIRLGLTAANLVTVAVGEAGKVRLRNGAGSVNLIADIAGYYSGSTTGEFIPVVPVRFLDTRNGTGGAPIPTTAGGFVDLKIAGTRGVPAGALAAVLNLTGTGVSSGTDVRAYPSDAATVPTVSNLNLAAGTTRANLAVVKPGASGAVRIRNQAGELDLIGDLAGYFRTPPP